MLPPVVHHRLDRPADDPRRPEGHAEPVHLDHHRGPARHHHQHAIWGKLSDLASKKVLVQLSIVVFVLGSVAAGWRTACRSSSAAACSRPWAWAASRRLSQSIMGAIVSPRERGRYGGYMGAVMAVSTVSGPLLGGRHRRHPVLGWRWTFYLCIPLAVISLILLQKTLTPPDVRRRMQFDYSGPCSSPPAPACRCCG